MSDVLKILNNYKDNFGFIGHFDDDGHLEFGDGTQRLGFFYLPQLFKSQINPSNFVFYFRICFMSPPEPLRYPGEPFRSPKENEWYAKPGTMSRDNLMSCLCALAFLGRKEELVFLFKRIIKRGGFLWNTRKIGQPDTDLSRKIADWSGFQVFSMILRGLIVSYDSAILYFAFQPIFFITDFFLFLSALFRLTCLYWDADNCGDCLNLICVLSTIKETRTETPFSYVTRVIYSGLHPGAGPNNRERIRGFGPLTSLQRYFAGDRNPPLDEIWKPYLIQEF